MLIVQQLQVPKKTSGTVALTVVGHERKGLPRYSCVASLWWPTSVQCVCHSVTATYMYRYRDPTGIYRSLLIMS